MDRKNPAPAGPPDRRGAKAPPEPATPPHRRRRPAIFGAVVAVGALGAWLLRREHPRAPEGTWRDLLSETRRDR